MIFVNTKIIIYRNNQLKTKKSIDKLNLIVYNAKVPWLGLASSRRKLSYRRIYKRREKMKINKAEIVKTYGKNEQDTGSIEVQIALLTAKISNLTEHLKQNKQDKHSTRGLNQMVSTRKKLLDYLSETDIERARSLKAKLGIRG